MRRKDREINNFDEIIKIIEECQIVRLGLADGDFPYIIPVNFAYSIQDNQIFLYIHGARAGKKYKLLSENPLCSFEMDIPLKIDCVSKSKSVTMRYKSIMGKAKVTFLEGKDKQEVIDEIIMNRYQETRNFEYNKTAVAQTAVARLQVIEITAKANPIPENTN